MPDFGTGESIVWIALFVFLAVITFITLMVWGIMRARTATKIPFTPMYLLGLVLGVLYPLVYAASDNDELVGTLGMYIFLLGIPLAQVWFALREVKKQKGGDNSVKPS